MYQSIYETEFAERPRYDALPESRTVDVAIIGGGWSGLAIAARFQELGVPWRGFESASDFGGTWHPKRRYAGLALHTAAWLASFAGFPFSAEPSACNARPSGEAMHEYLCRYAEHHKLRAGFEFNSRVVRIEGDSRARTAVLTVIRSDGEAAGGGSSVPRRRARDRRVPLRRRQAAARGDLASVARARRARRR